MHIVKKNINGHDYYYLNKSVRRGDKVKSINVAYLGKDKADAEKKAEEIKNSMINNTDISMDKEAMKKSGSSLKSDINKDKKEIKKKQGTRNINEGELTIETLTNFCKEKGFVFRSSDIYGGFAGFWDFGGLGVELFNNIKQDWWNFFVKSRENVVGIEASIISHPRTWKASGHIENFVDIFVKCKKCGKSGKLDENELGKVKCECGGDYESQGKFNLMFETKVGAVDSDTAYLRGETAQAMFMDFKLIKESSRKQLPFGIAQIGRCFRNEIAPRDFLFRSREFHIGEFEFFINPDEKKCDLLEGVHKEVRVRLLDAETQKKEYLIINNVKTNTNISQTKGAMEKSSKGKIDIDIKKSKEKQEEEMGLCETTIGKMLKDKRLGEWHAYWLAEQILWFNSIGLFEIRIREHTKDELSHYSSATFDIDYEYIFGSKEIAGNANRGQYDLTQHEKESKQSMEIYDDKVGKKVIPRVIEPTFGMERVFLAILTKAYNYDNERDYIVLKIPARLAPIKAAVFPIVKNEEYVEMAKEIVKDLKKEFNVIYDIGGSIGRRYARNDSIGTPYCITIDEKSNKAKDCTIRDRDTRKQIRVKIDNLKEVLKNLINGEVEFIKVGKLVK